jgi:predicted nucleotidyltransferase
MPTPKKNNRYQRKPVRNNELIRAKRILREKLPDLRELYSVKSLGVFGSYVRGEQKKRSDLDLLVEFEHAPDLFKFMDLEDYLGKQLGIKIDLIPRRALKGEIGKRILDEVVPI